MTTNIESLYMILGYPDTNIRQYTLSLDIFLQSICSFARDQLGVLINTRSMTVGLAEVKRSLTIEELTHWYKGRRSFTLLQEVTLCNGLEYWSNISRWG